MVRSLLAGPAAHLLLRLSGRLDGDSVPGVFERVRDEIDSGQAKRVLVDLRECSIALTISDMNDMVKMCAASFAGRVQRVALVLQARDIMTDKFFEPALTWRGVPTFTGDDYDEAVEWLSGKSRPGP
ncbi:MAG: STAS/SEC14 domain-containing protein [Polyangia bacterium]